MSNESGHWYSRNDGKPVYTVIGSNGQERGTTLRDARKLDLVPSVTTIIGVGAKPGLNQWIQREIVKATSANPRIDTETESEYIDRILKIQKEFAVKSAEAGTAIHNSVEAHFTGGENLHPVHVAGVVAKLNEAFGEMSWVCEKSFAHPMGYGGKADLHSSDGSILVDIKTKEFDAGDKVDAYEEHSMQLAAYRNGLLIPEAKCYNLFVSRSSPGLVELVGWNEDEIQTSWEMFECLLKFWQAKNKYR
jgi:hypothetical protein